ncbi:MAG: anti-anti-sigma factor [Paraglaciecola sp.]|jgi:anti-anti-sigma factor
MSLDRKFSEDGKQLTIFVDEKFDFGKVKDFRVAYTIDSESVRDIAIDLGKTEYMDSSALGMLLNMQKTMQENIKSFSIINCRPQVLKILRIARFDKKFTIV